MNIKKAIVTAMFLAGISGLAAESAPAHDSYHAELFRLMPGAAKVKGSDAHTYVISDKSGKVLGKVLLDSTKSEDKQIGFAGPIDVMVAVDAQDKILGVLIGKNEETPGFIVKVKKSGFLKRWNGMSMVKAAGLHVDTVTGATRSSSAIKSGVQAILRREAKKAGVTVAAEASKPVVLSAGEIKKLTARRDMLRKNVVFCRDLIKQWKKQEADELGVRFVYAVEGSEAGAKLAKAKGVRMFTHGKKELTPEQKALVEAYKKAPTVENKAALEANLTAEIARLKRAVVVHMREFERSADLIDAKLRAASPVCGMRFHSPEAKALEAKIQKLAIQYKKAPNAENEQALRAALKAQLDKGLTGMGKYVEKKEQEVKALKAKYDEIKANPQKSIDARFDQLTAKHTCGSCAKGVTCAKKAGKRCAHCKHAKSCKK